VKDYQKVYSFWFDEIDSKLWFRKDPSFDEIVTKRFKFHWERAKRGELFTWRSSSKGRLAEVLVLDQFPRNMFRDSPLAFETDPLALVLAQEAVRQNLDQELSLRERPFLYMPFMHSESIEVHESALHLFQQQGLENTLEYEKKHLEILKKFDRYPHRNQILGRSSSEEEKIFLSKPGSSF
jgi:uncharacterized protein (DUF924 family)